MLVLVPTAPPLQLKSKGWLVSVRPYLPQTANAWTPSQLSTQGLAGGCCCCCEASAIPLSLPASTVGPNVGCRAAQAASAITSTMYFRLSPDIRRLFTETRIDRPKPSRTFTY